jgi:hypothetical protein
VAVAAVLGMILFQLPVLVVPVVAETAAVPLMGIQVLLEHLVP